MSNNIKEKILGSIFIALGIFLGVVFIQMASAVQTGGSGHNNPENGIVSVFDDSDLPDPIANVITLEKDKTYTIIDIITIPDGVQIDLNGAVVQGFEVTKDSIFGNFDNGGLLISSPTNSVNISKFTIKNLGTNGKGIDFVGNTFDNCFLESIRFLLSDNAGDFEGFSLVSIMNSAIVGMNNGLLFKTGNEGIFIDNLSAGPSNLGTLLKSEVLPGGVFFLRDSFIAAPVGITGIDLDNSTSAFFRIVIDGTDIINLGGTSITGFSSEELNVQYDALAAEMLNETYHVPDFNINRTTEVDAILDEDDMASDSATALVTQQSMKAYADFTGSGAFTNSITVTLNSDVNNWNPAGWGDDVDSIIIIGNSTDVKITGLLDVSFSNGQGVIIVNDKSGGAKITLEKNSGSSSADNRFDFVNDIDILNRQFFETRRIVNSTNRWIESVDL